MSKIEQQIQSDIQIYLRNQGAYVVNVITASRKGVPDLLVCYKGLFLALEIKRPETKKNTSKVQEMNLKFIKNSGGKSYTVYSLQQVRQILDILNKSLI